MTPRRKTKPTDVSPARYAAWRALTTWDSTREAADKLLESVRIGLDSRDQRLAHQLFYGVLLRLATLDFLLDRVLNRPLRKLSPGVRAILRLGVYQLGADFRAPDHAVVSQSVALAYRTGSRWAVGLVNATLRRLAREQVTLLEALHEPEETADFSRLATLYSHPEWLVRRLADRAGGDLVAALEADNAHPPLTLRVNLEKVSLRAFLDHLSASDLEASASPRLPAAVHILTPVSPRDIPGYGLGWFTVQDEGSQMVGFATNALSGDQVLDVCAAPGGKTLHLAELVGPQGHVYATDASPRRLRLLEDVATRSYPQRISLAVHAWGQQKRDARVAPPPARRDDSSSPARPAARQDLVSDLPSNWPRSFDRVLVDAPCSGLGVIRRHPDIKWQRRPEEIPAYADRQVAILGSVADRVRPGGTLTYSVCTFTREETDLAIGRFLQARPDFREVDLKQVLDTALTPLVNGSGHLVTLPHRDGCDAFFVVLLERTFGET